MCGITGFLDFDRQTPQETLLRRVTAMSDTIVARGPDDSGAWGDERFGVALSARRLAIQDLSPAGHQPMCSADGRYWIAFNGEIYNFIELRQELIAAGDAFRGGSDTEVILAAVCAWGLERTVTRLNGMFAFALWDSVQNCLHLVRDRLGIKPLYYGWMGQTLLFGSELKTLRAHPAFAGEVDRNSLALYMRHKYIPAPYTIYDNVYKLTPGSMLHIQSDAPRRRPQPQVYWSARQVAESGCAQPFAGSEREAMDALDELLREAVRLRMIADVPLGAFLSGGVDSSLIVALMQAQSGRPVKTFTIGFNEKRHDEARHARAVAQHLGSEHTELYVLPGEAEEVIPLLPHLYDEPFADPSQIPTYLVAKLTRRHVTVSLSGDGGDELFGGYPRYEIGQRVWGRVNWLPAPLRRSVSAALQGLLPEADATPGTLHKVAEILSYENEQAFYNRLVSTWSTPLKLVPGASEPPTPLNDPAQWPQLPDFTRQMMCVDLITYLPDDILAKVDRASMGVSLEARVPYLDDHRVVEFAWRLPLSMKVRAGQSKWLLRQLLHRYVPAELVERPKKGFGVPIETWLRGPLRPWAEELLDEKRLQREGFFNPQPIRQKWAEHLAGNHDWHYYLWNVLMFQAWLDYPSR